MLSLVTERSRVVHFHALQWLLQSVWFKRECTALTWSIKLVQERSLFESRVLRKRLDFSRSMRSMHDVQQFFLGVVMVDSRKNIYLF